MLTRNQKRALERENEHRSAVANTRPEFIRDPTPVHRIPRYLNEEDEDERD